jgi:hypothetical protein
MLLKNELRMIITANFYAFVYKLRVLCYLCIRLNLILDRILL